MSAADNIVEVIRTISNKRWREIAERLELSTTEIMEDRIITLQVVANEIKRAEDNKEHWREIDNWNLFETLEFLGLSESDLDEQEEAE